jgi:hypothetical protein
MACKCSKCKKKYEAKYYEPKYHKPHYPSQFLFYHPPARANFNPPGQSCAYVPAAVNPFRRGIPFEPLPNELMTL